MMENDYIKMLTGMATDEEKERFYAFLEANPEEKQAYLKLLNVWNLSEMDSFSLSNERKKILFSQFWDKVNRTRRFSLVRMTAPLLRYAAIIVFAVLTTWIFSVLQHRAGQQPVKTEFSASTGSISVATLNDGTDIWLNANSQITVLQQRKKIMASLVGEAYFNVSQHPGREFVVDIGRIRVRNLGTEFNISSYPDHHVVNITLLKGDIDVTDAAGQVIRNLDPGETFGFNKNENTYRVTRIDPSLVTAWKDGKFVFIDRTLADICKELEKWYGISIIIEDQSMRDIKFTSIMKRTTTVESVLKMLKITTNIDYVIEDKVDGKDVIRLK